MAQRAVRPPSRQGAPRSRRTPEPDIPAPNGPPEPSRAPARPPLDAYFGRTPPGDAAVAPEQTLPSGDTFLELLNRRFGR